jgi:hypothetical protein
VDEAAAQGSDGVSWSAEQLRMLRAMGHEPMSLAPVGTPVGAAVSRDFSGRESQSRLTDAPTGETSSVAVLAAAISRAADGRDLSALALDLNRLRREPALKRALWPRLRALRKQH